MRASGERRLRSLRRTTCPTPLPLGQSWRARLSDTTTTPASAVRSAGVKPRPLTTSRPSTAKYSDDTASWSTGIALAVAARTFRRLHASAATTRPRSPPTDGSSGPGGCAARRVSVSIETLSVSLVRTPGSRVAAAKAPRRKMAAQIRRSADAPTWTAIRVCRARRGRASLVTSPRMVRTRSRRVACSAGASPKNTVDTTAPATRNTSTRQSAAGAARFNMTHELDELRRDRRHRRRERTLEKQPRDDKSHMPPPRAPAGGSP